MSKTEEERLPATHYVLPEEEVKSLTNGVYVYKCVNESLLEPYLIPTWDKLASQLPGWVHPNMLTLVGSLSLLPSFLLFAYYSPAMTSEVPGFVYLLAVLGMMLFQTLDNLDGRQARRLRLSSPIGDWFDHSLDILSLYITITQVAAALGGGHSQHPLFLITGQLSTTVTHYFCFWDRRFTRELYLGPVSMTEAQYFLSLVYLLGWSCGPGFWAAPLLAGSTWRRVDLVAIAATLMFTVIGPAGVLRRVARHPARLGSLRQALLSAWDMGLVWSGALLWAAYSDLEEVGLRFAMLTLGICNANVTTSMLLASITLGRSRGPWCAVVPWLGALHAVAGHPWLSPLAAYYVIFFVAVALHTFLLAGVLRDMRGHLQIRLFHVPHQNQLLVNQKKD